MIHSDITTSYAHYTAMPHTHAYIPYLQKATQTPEEWGFLLIVCQAGFERQVGWVGGWVPLPLVTDTRMKLHVVHAVLPISRS